MIARLAIFGLLFQAFFAALHLPGIRAAEAASGIEGGLVICSGSGIRQLPAGDGGSAPGTGSPADSNSCLICLTLSGCALAMPVAMAAETPMPPRIAPLVPAAQEAMHDHREAIRPGRAPPASL